MSHTLFISDLHLRAEHAQITQSFMGFLQHTAPQAEALYILGDFFEAWAGDDDMSDPYHQQIVSALRKLSDGGTRLYLMHGNRDFLMAQELERTCGATLLADPTTVDLYGKRYLLSHGDALCTDDKPYQAFRAQVRNSLWQQQFLAQPLPVRKAMAAQAREQSKGANQTKDYGIMDVNGEAVAQLLRTHGYPTLIHGHTHRMAHHVLHVDAHTCERWVLGDWETLPGNALRCDADGCRMIHA